jgi:hypothetical protein
MHPARCDTNRCQDGCGGEDWEEKPHLISSAHHTDQSEPNDEGQRPCDQESHSQRDEREEGSGVGAGSGGDEKGLRELEEKKDEGEDSEEDTDDVERIECEQSREIREGVARHDLLKIH